MKEGHQNQKETAKKLKNETGRKQNKNKYDVNVADSACVEELDCILNSMSSNIGNEKD